MSDNNDLLVKCLKNPICLTIGAFLLFKYAKNIDAKFAADLIEEGEKLIKSTNRNKSNKD